MKIDKNETQSINNQYNINNKSIEKQKTKNYKNI